ncbi:MAG: hypothetical protein AAGI07_19405 [Bacteroidota bacterium]
MKIGIVTSRLVPNLVDSEKYLLAELQQLGEVKVLIWNDKNVNWENYDVLIIRSIWDYYLEIAQFKKWLSYLKNTDVKVLNPISVIQQNYHKFYLKELLKNKLPIIPTYFLAREEQANFSWKNWLTNHNWEHIVLKPAVSASAWHTYRLKGIAEITTFKFPVNTDWLIQPFIPEIATNGEVSLMFFNRKFSHAVLKKSKQGDFRVQKEYGGTVSFFEPDKNIVGIAERILQHINGELLYCRVDGVLTENGFKIMEVELIEPELFLLDAVVRNNFSNAIRQILNAS